VSVKRRADPTKTATTTTTPPWAAKKVVESRVYNGTDVCPGMWRERSNVVANRE
jgi:hypothetical protein